MRRYAPEGRLQVRRAREIAVFLGAVLATGCTVVFPPFLYGYEANYEWRYRRYRRRLEELFARRRVHLFLGGHEHALELLRPASEGQPYALIMTRPAATETLGSDDPSPSHIVVRGQKFRSW
ncbi:MAG: hypothetical protein ACREQ9_17400 [Candidatus Binatia bacterium]